MSSPPLNDSLIVAVKYDCNQGLDWYSREPGFDRNKLQDLGFDRLQEAGNNIRNRDDRSSNRTAGLGASPLTDLVYYNMGIYQSISSTGVPFPPCPQ